MIPFVVEVVAERAVADVADYVVADVTANAQNELSVVESAGNGVAI